MRRTLIAAALAVLPLAAGAVAVVPVAYLDETRPAPEVLAGLTPPPADLGRSGAELAIKDNDTTGKFTGQRFVLKPILLAANESAASAYAKLAGSGTRLVVARLPGATLDKLMQAPQFKNYLWFNAGAPDDRLRQSQCRANLLHPLPGRAMQADALAQYLVKRNWKRWYLVYGGTREDALYVAALDRAAKRFGGKIVGRKLWTLKGDTRGTAQSEIPVFTQVGDYDVMLVADEHGAFGDYFPYRTWLPRPVAGTQGLMAAAWSHTAEQWGALQLQRRFLRLAKRPMQSEDFAAWAAVRSVGQAATHTGSARFEVLSAYIRSDRFTLDAFKGNSLSYRGWNGELRQPLLVTTERALVSVSPQDGFLHPRTELDTLGFDAPEVHCRPAP
jgi:ABC transporter substrate binding protein (PQQ-dependent alcohol dehydrogenase system)